MPPRRDPGFTFLPELTQLIQQQNALMQMLIQNQGNNNNNPPPPPPVDNLTRFLRLNPPVFSSSTEPIVADDWLRKIGRDLTTVGTSSECTCSLLVGKLHRHLSGRHHDMGSVPAGFPHRACLRWSHESEEA